MSQNIDFDTQAAWLRRFSSDAESNLRAFALRLQEALPGQVTLHESRGFFARAARMDGVTVELGDNRYTLEVEGGRLKASIGLVVRGISLNTRTLPPADWFARLADETRQASDHARALSQSLNAFMAE